MIEFKAIDEECWILTAEGQTILAEGSHEVKVFNFIPEGSDGVSVSSIKVLYLSSLFEANTLIYRSPWENPVKLDKARRLKTSGLVYEEKMLFDWLNRSRTRLAMNYK